MNKLVIIVDDEPDISLLLSKRIQFSFGYKTKSISEGKEASENIEKLQPNLVILDIWLQDISGFEVFKQIKSNPRTRHIPIVFFSADSSKEQYCIQTLKAEGFMKKPYDASILQEIFTKIQNSSLEEN